MSFLKNKRLGQKYFREKNFSLALKFFSLAFNQKPRDEELELYVLLSSLGINARDEAVAISEIYLNLKQADKVNSYNFAKLLIDFVEKDDVIFLNNDHKLNQKGMLVLEDGITYDDFKELLKQNNEKFKTLFKRIMFSTKIILTDKEDFFDFIEGLIKNSFLDMAIAYIDNANDIFPSNDRIRELLNLIQKIDYFETRNKQ